MFRNNRNRSPQVEEILRGFQQTPFPNLFFISPASSRIFPLRITKEDIHKPPSMTKLNKHLNQPSQNCDFAFYMDNQLYLNVQTRCWIVRANTLDLVRRNEAFQVIQNVLKIVHFLRGSVDFYFN